MVPNHKATSRMILSDHLGLQHPALGLNPFLWVWQYLFLGPGICRGEIVQEIVLPDALFSGLTWEKLSCELNMETPCSSGKSQLSVCLYYMGIITGMIGNLSVYLRRLFTCISSISLLWLCLSQKRGGSACLLHPRLLGLQYFLEPRRSLTNCWMTRWIATNTEGHNCYH